MSCVLNVRIPHRPEYEKLHHNFEQESNIKKQSGVVCQAVGLEPDEYRFAYEKDGKIFYYTEDNKDQLRDGDTVLLMRSPTLIAQTAKNDLDSYGKNKALDDLDNFVHCPKFIERFIAVEGMQSLTKAVAGGHFNGPAMNKALKLIRVLLVKGVDKDHFYTDEFLKRLCAELTPCPEHIANIEITLAVLSLLARIKPDEIFLYMPLNCIAENLSHGLAEVPKNTLMLLNALLSHLNEIDQQELVSSILEISDEFSEKLLARYAEGRQRRDACLHRQLRLFQTRLLRGRYLPMYQQGRDDAHVREFRAFLEQILNTHLGRPDPNSKRYIDAVKRIGGTAEEYEDVLRPGEKFFITFRQIDGLTLHCVKHFETHHSTVLYPWMKEINIVPSEYICPLLQSSILLTDLMVDILHITSDPPDEEAVALRMFLTNMRLFLEEFFSIGLKLVLKTWREMRARSGDIQKVFAIVREQLTLALENQMTCWSFEQLQAMLYATPYTLISQKLEAEQAKLREDPKRTDLLTRQLNEKIWKLVKESKITKLIEGLEFSRINDRGSRVKNKTVVVRLAHDRHQIRVIIDHRTVAIPLGDVLRIETMKQCQHYRKDDYALTILSKDSAQVQVATTNRETFEDIWDALHALTGLRLESDSAQSDFRLLMELELKLASLELEGIELPETPPAVPNDPDDLDFRALWNG
ncbi:engulfment and cell motility protein 1 [Galendromus occidentalis]|uniref:Engulfment and cell motility protein 1 n=1 Tax=Galendromus occidentalis TaxID=34638 RepID=A0AAJ7PB22_9ACAR|nr:engulfment and cell motility protein 1 [Galendromus occidentalis]